MKMMMILLMTLLEFQILFHHHLHPVVIQQPLHSNFQSHHPWLKHSNLHLKTPILVLLQRFQHHPNQFPHQQPILIHPVQLLDVKIGKKKGFREYYRNLFDSDTEVREALHTPISEAQLRQSDPHLSTQFGPTVTSRHHHPP